MYKLYSFNTEADCYNQLFKSRDIDELIAKGKKMVKQGKATSCQISSQGERRYYLLFHINPGESLGNRIAVVSIAGWIDNI